MAVQALPNPKKQMTVDFSLSQITEAVKAIPLLKKTYIFSKANEMFNQYTFEAYEFLSLGVYIDIHLNSIAENKTVIEIEIRRKVGTFDFADEITKANRYLDDLFMLIAEGVRLGKFGIENLQYQNITKNSNKNYDEYSDKSGLTTLLLCIFLGFLGVHRFYTKNYVLGVLYFFTMGGFGFAVFIDIILLVISKYKDGDNQVVAL